MSYANGIWLANLDGDAWKLKVHHGFLQPFGTVGSLDHPADRPASGRNDAVAWPG